MTPEALRAAFSRGLETEYERRSAIYRSEGLTPEAAHDRALEEVKQLGRESLEMLRDRGEFPWLSEGEVGHA